MNNHIFSDFITETTIDLIEVIQKDRHLDPKIKVELIGKLVQRYRFNEVVQEMYL